MNFMTWLRCEWDRVAGYTLAAAGGVLVVVGGLAARGAPTTIDALSYIATAGLIGLVCLIFGVGLLVSADLHDEWHKLDRIEAALRGEARADAERPLDLVGRYGSSAVSSSGRLLADVTGQRPGPTGASLTVAVPSHGRAARLLPAAAVAPVAVLWLGARQASSSSEFATAGRGVWIAALGVTSAAALAGVAVRMAQARVGRRRADLLAPLVSAAPPAVVAVDAVRADDPVVWVADGLRHFHRRDCPALAGLQATAIVRDEVGAGFVPCGLCTSRR